MRTPLTLAVAVLLGAALPLLPVPASSAGRAAVATAATTATTARPDVAASRFPTVNAVARIFPAYRGGGREFFRSTQISTTSDDCVGFVMASVQPRAGKVANYLARGGQSPFFTGGTSVVVTVHDLRRPKLAQAALDEQRADVESCYGRHEEDGYGTTYTALDVPRLAQDQFAYRFITHDPNVGGDWFVSAYAREGRFLVEARLQRDRNAPATRPAFQLARASVRALS